MDAEYHSIMEWLSLVLALGMAYFPNPFITNNSYA